MRRGNLSLWLNASTMDGRTPRGKAKMAPTYAAQVPPLDVYLISILHPDAFGSMHPVPKIVENFIFAEPKSS